MPWVKDWFNKVFAEDTEHDSKEVVSNTIVVPIELVVTVDYEGNWLVNGEVVLWSRRIGGVAEEEPLWLGEKFPEMLNAVNKYRGKK